MASLLVAFFVAALLYASVGFGGGSTYTALLALAEVDYRLLPLLSLACNIVVVAGSSVRFARARVTPWRSALVLTGVAAPAALIGGLTPIGEATFLAMKRAIAIMGLVPERILVDGNCLPQALPCAASAIIKGDLTEPSISAASILAKVARDRAMVELSNRFPGYGLRRHKGYGTPEHAEALEALGPCACHRRSFAPVQRALRAA